MSAKTKFYFIRQDNDAAYELSATTKVSISKKLNATKRAVESGKSLTDNVYLENTEVSFSGLITNINNKSSLTDVNVFLDEIDELRASDPPVLIDFYADGRFVPNCVITDLSIDKSSQEGLGAWLTTFKLTEITFAERAAVVKQLEPKPANKDEVSPKTSTSSNTVMEVDPALAAKVRVQNNYVLAREYSLNDRDNT